MCTVLAVSPVYTVKPFSTWSEPENLGEAVNSSYEEFLPELSKDEFELVLLRRIARGHSEAKTSGCLSGPAERTPGDQP